MPLTPETLTRHELNGLYTEVVDSPNPDLVGIAGRVVVETMGMLHIDTGAAAPSHGRDGDAVADERARVRQVPKEGTTFEFRLPAETRTDARGTDTPSNANTNTNTESTDDRRRDVPTVASRRSRTDEAAEAAKASGTTSELVSEPDQPATDADSLGRTAARDEAGEGVAYVTVDGTRLLSRPALRTENAGESTWR
jgi:ribonuclease P protein subunit POP4